MLRSPDPPLYPDEAEIARRVLGDRAREWPGEVVILEREGLLKIDPLMGGRFWPPYRNFSSIATVLQRNRLTARRCPQIAACASFPLRRTGSPTLIARKRKPLVVSGEIVQLDAPGLNVFERRGRVELYWKPNAEARKRRYVPRSVPLHFDLSTAASRLELERRCRVLTSELLA
jgi:hypothetical protein